jgi:HEAT repeat protein
MEGPSDPLIAKLVQQLHDADPVARRNAAGALRLHGAQAAGAISELRGLLADEDAKVRAEARHALDRLRQPAA